MGESELAGFALLHHVAYLDAMASEVPHDCATQEVNHLTLVHFAVAGLSLLRGLNRVNKEQIINWVLSFQIHPESNNDLDNGQFYGFCGSRTTQFPTNNVKARVVSYDVANIDSKALLSSMKKLQQPDGSFMPTHIGAETDLRLVYCAAAICSMLKDWTGMDKEKKPRNTFSIASHMMVALAWFLVQNLM